MSQIIGIDLGTTFSAMAQVRDGVPRIMQHGDERIMPSVVGVAPGGGLLVGTPARNQYVLYPERTVRSIKRRMGTDEQVTLGDRSYTPQAISAMILRELTRSAEAQLGEPVEREVITAPAYFSDAARQATREAGEIAGFTVERIINEPTAAALAYGLDRGEEHQLVAVYDLGGGTFDVSIVELDAGVVEVRASHGDTQLGGDDFDELLVNHLAERFMEEHGADPRTDNRALARLTRAAETAKIALSGQPFVQVREEFLLSENGRPLHLDVEVSREQFEELIQDLLQGTLESLDAALADANITASDLNRVLFVGGSTRIPLVREMVEAHTGITPDTTVNPDEAVALGAAVQAAIIAGEPLEAILVDVTPHSLGIEVADWEFGQLVTNRYSVIIDRNTTIPTARSEVYTALSPRQTVVHLKIYQGEHAVASRNTLLGDFRFEGLRPERPGEPPRVTVNFDFNLDGILNVSALDRGSGKQARTTVEAARTRLSPAEITDVRTDLEALGWADDEGDEGSAQATDSGPAAALLARARRAVERAELDTSDLEGVISELEEALQAGDTEVARELTDELLDLLYEHEEE